MLVAFQRTGDAARLPAAAEHLVGLLSSWGPGPDHLTGLALTGITLPSRLGPRSVDALVFTRSGVVVIAAHSPGAGVSPGPGERAGAGVAAAKGALAAHDGGQYVTGLVAVVPPVPASEQWADRPEPAMVPQPRDPLAESRPRGGAAETGGRAPEPADPVRSEQVPAEPGRAWREPGPGEPDSAWREPFLGESKPDRAWHEPDWDGDRPDSVWREPDPGEREPAPPWHEADSFPGVAVVLADPRGLRRIIGQHNRWRTVWSADDVLDACYALSLAHLAPPRAALLADGFPARLPTLSRLPELPAVVPVPPDPPIPAPDDDPGPPIPVSRGRAVFPRPRPIRQVPWGLVFVLTVLVTLGVLAAVFVAQVFHGS
ncbi:hypothetical protein QRX60_36965 [Amycolatopsis mongoliensis]|uniref:NERD domain-containing protein n=1 Tax=Amycolatopsis mongoliensis TaxID=715475 RepID=A0A9Y2JJG5_9PSEU|nr:hypothetical protein [Amycolatopsis sp. 4-36]WIX99607.1 hypothetical protein QRX60_36965 [Amycolatopsis sp. 4-36]